MMKAVFLICLIMACSIEGVRRRCKDCPKDTSPCDQRIGLIKENCTCDVCITRCNYRHDTCEPGMECTEVPSDFSEKLMVAKCVEFTKCSEQECEVKCPISGYYMDDNNCNTCVCNNPCAELKCENNCISWATSTFLEPNSKCIEDGH